MSRVSAGCKRISIDIPISMHNAIVTLASEAPKLPLAEWCRRVLAHHADFHLPSQAEREEQNVRLDGKARLPNIVEQRRSAAQNG